MRFNTEQLPFGVASLSRKWQAAILILVGFISFGVYAYSRQWSEGLIVTGLRDIGTMGGAAWGLYISFDIYFVGVSFAGITLAALIRLLNLKQLKPISRMAEVVTVISLILAGLTILPDLGQPVRGLTNLFRYARPQSPFFGTFTLVISGYLFGSMVYLYLDVRRDAAIMAQKSSRFQSLYKLIAAGYRDTPAERARHSTTSLWLSIAILPLLITAHSTLGFVFGLQAGRPGWFGSLQAPAFVIMAGISGIGVLMIITAILRKVLGLEEQLKPEIFKWMGNFTIILILTYLYFMVVDWLTGSYAAAPHEARVSDAILIGEYAWLFWGVVLTLVVSAGILISPYLPSPKIIENPNFRRTTRRLARATGTFTIALLAVLAIEVFNPTEQAVIGLPTTFMQWLPLAAAILALLSIVSYIPFLRESIIARSVLSGILVNLAAIAKRYLIVVPSQTHGTLLPYNVGSYSPTWVEYSIILGLLAFGVLLFITFLKIFPIMEVEASKSDPIVERKPGPETGLTTRSILSLGLVVIGFALQFVSYFFLAAPIGIPTNESFSNPRLPYSPALFIGGVMLVFLAAIVYELFPEREVS
ncbi:MAG: hypothetical protein FVQ83_07700 [Chloroflexi bacterium]|nr:hypothetical protein [Chloroflexota bacterium]